MVSVLLVKCSKMSGSGAEEVDYKRSNRKTLSNMKKLGRRSQVVLVFPGTWEISAEG